MSGADTTTIPEPYNFLNNNIPKKLQKAGYVRLEIDNLTIDKIKEALGDSDSNIKQNKLLAQFNTTHFTDTYSQIQKDLKAKGYELTENPAVVEFDIANQALEITLQAESNNEPRITREVKLRLTSSQKETASKEFSINDRIKHLNFTLNKMYNYLVVELGIEEEKAKEFLEKFIQKHHSAILLEPQSSVKEFKEKCQHFNTELNSEVLNKLKEDFRIQKIKSYAEQAIEELKELKELKPELNKPLDALGQILDKINDKSGPTPVQIKLMQKYLAQVLSSEILENIDTNDRSHIAKLYQAIEKLPLIKVGKNHKNSAHTILIKGMERMEVCYNSNNPQKRQPILCSIYEPKDKIHYEMATPLSDNVSTDRTQGLATARFHLLGNLTASKINIGANMWHVICRHGIIEAGQKNITFSKAVHYMRSGSMSKIGATLKGFVFSKQDKKILKSKEKVVEQVKQRILAKIIIELQQILQEDGLSDKQRKTKAKEYLENPKISFNAILSDDTQENKQIDDLKKAVEKLKTLPISKKDFQEYIQNNLESVEGRDKLEELKNLAPKEIKVDIIVKNHPNNPAVTFSAQNIINIIQEIDLVDFIYSKAPKYIPKNPILLAAASILPIIIVAILFSLGPATWSSALLSLGTIAVLGSIASKIIPDSFKKTNKTLRSLTRTGSIISAVLAAPLALIALPIFGIIAITANNIKSIPLTRKASAYSKIALATVAHALILPITLSAMKAVHELHKKTSEPLAESNPRLYKALTYFSYTTPMYQFSRMTRERAYRTNTKALKELLEKKETAPIFKIAKYHLEAGDSKKTISKSMQAYFKKPANKQTLLGKQNKEFKQEFLTGLYIRLLNDEHLFSDNPRTNNVLLALISNKLDREFDYTAVSFCKSGEDRTGLVMALQIVFDEYIDGKVESESGKQKLLNLITSSNQEGSLLRKEFDGIFNQLGTALQKSTSELICDSCHPGGGKAQIHVGNKNKTENVDLTQQAPPNKKPNMLLQTHGILLPVRHTKAIADVEHCRDKATLAKTGSKSSRNINKKKSIWGKIKKWGKKFLNGFKSKPSVVIPKKLAPATPAASASKASSPITPAAQATSASKASSPITPAAKAAKAANRAPSLPEQVAAEAAAQARANQAARTNSRRCSRSDP